MGVGEIDQVGVMLGDEVAEGSWVGNDVTVGVDVLVAMEVGLLIGAAVSVIRYATCVSFKGVTVTRVTVTVERLEVNTKNPSKSGMNNQIR